MPFYTIVQNLSKTPYIGHLTHIRGTIFGVIILLSDFDLDLPEILSNSGVGQSDSKAS